MKSLPAAPTEQIDAFATGFSVHSSPKVQKLVRSMFLPDSNPSLVEFVAKDMSSAPSHFLMMEDPKRFNEFLESAIRKIPK